MKNTQPMETLLLRDEAIPPTEDVLDAALGSAYPSFETFIAGITEEPLMLSHEWRYYQDGKAWLCKITCKKRTICWLSVWDGFFKVTSYFPQRYLPEIETVCPDKEAGIYMSKPVGKSLPVTADISYQKQVYGFMKVLELKKRLK
jgi:hypothetical protein